ncbi:MAG: hypothetical protein KatS3mg005_2274 [Bryobacteraceae bacterium]|jgi:hypothetical protein|nr:MAG: hypothetical protein KatS3mg005_2274 [Bryobacteraceae bacterium]
MAHRSKSTFNKRQREAQRVERRQEKEARKQARREHKISPDSPEAIGSVEELLPEMPAAPSSLRTDFPPVRY